MKRLSFKFPLRFISLIMATIFLLSAFAPSAMAVTSDLGNKMSKPWIESSMPWSPTKWGYFNTGTKAQTEAAGGACFLRATQIEQYKKIIDVLQVDWKQIQSNGANGNDPKKLARLFNKDVTSRLATGRPPAELKDAAPPIRSGGSSGSNVIGGSVDAAVAVAQNIPGAKSGWQPFTASWLSPLKKSNDFQGFVNVSNSIPQLAGCDTGGKSISSIVKTMIPNPKDIFSQPAAFIIRMVLFLPFILGYILYQLTSSLSLQATFTTPHSERGDTLVDTISAQKNISKGLKASAADCKKRSNTGTQGCIAKTVACKKGVKVGESASTQLGFNCKNAIYTSNSDKNSWIIIAKAFRTLLSALYGVIVIAVALIYLFRRNSNSQYDVKIILPKVVGAVLLSAVLPFIVGFLITTSNFIVQGTFSGSPTGSIPNMLSAGILQVQTASDSMAGGSDGFITGVPAQLASAILPTIVLIVIAFGLMFLLAAAVIKQLGLILLMIAMPFACLSFVIPKWNGLFAMWCRGLVAIIMIPIIQAFIMRVGLELNTALIGIDKGAPGVMAALMAAIVLCVTVIAMCLVMLKFKTYVTGNKSHGMTKKFAGAAMGATAVAGTGGLLGAGKVASAAKKGGENTAKFAGATGSVAAERIGSKANSSGLNKHIAAGAASVAMRGAVTREKFKDTKANASERVKGLADGRAGQAIQGQIASAKAGPAGSVGRFVGDVADKAKERDGKFDDAEFAASGSAPGMERDQSEEFSNASVGGAATPERKSALARMKSAYSRGNKATQAYVDSKKHSTGLIPKTSGSNPLAAPSTHYGRKNDVLAAAMKQISPEAGRAFEKQRDAQKAQAKEQRRTSGKGKAVATAGRGSAGGAGGNTAPPAGGAGATPPSAPRVQSGEGYKPSGGSLPGGEPVIERKTPSRPNREPQKAAPTPANRVMENNTQDRQRTPANK